MALRLIKCIKKRTGILDYDETLVDFVNPFLGFYNRRHKTTFTKEMIDFYNMSRVFKISDEEICGELNLFYESRDFPKISPLKGAIDGVKKLSQKYDLRIMTSRPYHIKEHTLKNISQNFDGQFNEIYFKNKNKKMACLSEKSDEISFLIEDDLTVVLEAAKLGIPSLLMDRKWNQDQNLPSRVRRVGNLIEEGSHWREIVEILT